MNFKHTPWNQKHTIWFQFEAYLSILSHPMSTAAADCQVPFQEMPQLSNSGGFITSWELLQKGAGLWSQDKVFIVLCSFISF